MKNGYAGYSRKQLVSALDQLHGLHNAILHEMLLVTAELERRGAHLEDGQRSIGSWLQLHLGVNGRTAQRWSEVASRVDDLPSLTQSFSSGRISFDKLVACAAHATPETDNAVAEEAEKLDAAMCERAARRRREVNRSDEEKAAASKRLSFSWAEMGTRLDVWASLPADEGATLVSAIERIADSLPLRDAEGNLSSRPVRQADALVMLAQTAIAENQDPDRATVSIHVPLETLLDGRGVGENASGGVHSATVMQRLTCDARVQGVIENTAGEVVGISSTLRTVPNHIRRQLDRRDGGMCRFPGCASRAFLDAHHITWWTEGGATEVKNLALLCRWHHRLVHEKGWRIEGDPGGSLSFIRPDGTTLEEGPAPLAAATQEWLWDRLLKDGGTDVMPERGPPVLV